MKAFETPVLFIVFNRPDTTKEVLHRLKEARPKNLYIASDGPRKHVPADFDRCNQVRELIDKEIDWECNIVKYYNEHNLGCGKAVSGAITWFFENVEYGIIIEDDCVPNMSFFKFCEEILNKYNHDENVYSVTGQNLQNNISRGDGSYYFSKYFYLWGWATWRRAWSKYSYLMDGWPSYKNNEFKTKFSESGEYSFWLKTLENCYQGKVDTWDYQFQYTIFKNDGKTIVPNVNLISNIGFGADATHTKSENSDLANAETKELAVIKHPTSTKINDQADKYFYYKTICNYSEYDDTNLSLQKILLKNRLNKATRFLKKIMRRLSKSK